MAGPRTVTEATRNGADPEGANEGSESAAGDGGDGRDAGAAAPLYDEDGRMVELEFDLGGGEFFLVEASERAACRLRLEEVVHRSDGTALEFLSVVGAEPERVVELAEAAPTIETARLLRVDGDTGEALFEFVSDSPVAATLADAETTVTRIEATAGEGRLVAEVPPHVDAGAVAASFLEQYPGASLAAKRVTDRTAPLLTANQLRSSLLGGLTEKQLQAVRTAHAVGYYDWPREMNAGEVAAELGVAKSTFTQHLRAAERKLLDGLFVE